MKKVIYIGYQPITTKFYFDFYVDKCLDNGIEVEYWDISKLYFPSINFDVIFDFNGVKYIKSFRELKALLTLTEINSTIFITNITYEFKVWRLYSLLSSFKCIHAFFGRGQFPAPKKTLTYKIWEVFLSLNYRRIVNGFKKMLGIVLIYFKIIKKYNVIFRAGSAGYITEGVNNLFDSKNGKIIDVNYFDYDKYLECINGKPLFEKTYCVFLDEYLPYHPDFSMFGIKTVKADNYYSQLNKFFDLIEIKFNISVIIAAHPKALRYSSENPFMGRMTVLNKTCELVKDAKFVMTHHSTSISFPILFKKPIFFITSQAQKKRMHPLYKLTLYLGKFLNCKVIHFDDFNERDNLNCFVDIEKYDNYKYMYLTSKESENKQSSEIFIEEIL